MKMQGWHTLAFRGIDEVEVEWDEEGVIDS